MYGAQDGAFGFARTILRAHPLPVHQPYVEAICAMLHAFVASDMYLPQHVIDAAMHSCVSAIAPTNSA